MEKCDHKSVGVIIEDGLKNLLLIQRAKFPFGLAAPAGHVDNHGSLEQTAEEEVYEETGLTIVRSSLEKIINNRRIENQCRRGGKYHFWTIYKGIVQGNPQFSEDETKGGGWYSRPDLQRIADNTRANHLAVSEPSKLVFEPLWLDILAERGYVS